MKKILVLFLFSSFVLFGDWGSSDSDNLRDIKSYTLQISGHTGDIKAYTIRNYEKLSEIESNTSQYYDSLNNIEDVISTNLPSIYDLLYNYVNYVYDSGRFTNSDIKQTVTGYNSYDKVIIEGQNFTIPESDIKNISERIYPFNMHLDVYKDFVRNFNYADDRTLNYINFINNPYEMIVGGEIDDFIDDWKTGDVLNSAYHFNNDLVDGEKNEGAVTEDEINIENKDLNVVASSFNSYKNILETYQPSSDVLFNLNLSSIGDIFSSITHGSNKWNGFNVEVSLNPSENRPYVYRAWKTWNKFYVEKNGRVIIDLCFVCFAVLLYWNSFKSILQMD